MIYYCSCTVMYGNGTVDGGLWERWVVAVVGAGAGGGGWVTGMEMGNGQWAIGATYELAATNLQVAICTQYVCHRYALYKTCI